MQTSRADTIMEMSTAILPQQDDWHAICFSTLKEMAGAIESVVSAMAGLGYSEKDLFGARLTLEEAICNAIKHGNQNEPTKWVVVRYCIGADRSLIEVEDQGRGFDPTQIPDARAPENRERPCDRGLLLMRYYAAWVRYNRTGNCVTFCIFPSEPLPTHEVMEARLEVVRI